MIYHDRISIKKFTLPLNTHNQRYLELFRQIQMTSRYRLSITKLMIEVNCIKQTFVQLFRSYWTNVLTFNSRINLRCQLIFLTNFLSNYFIYPYKNQTEKKQLLIAQ